MIDVDKSITVLYLLTIVFVGAVGFLPSPTFALDVSARAIKCSFSVESRHNRNRGSSSRDGYRHLRLFMERALIIISYTSERLCPCLCVGKYLDALSARSWSVKEVVSKEPS